MVRCDGKQYLRELTLTKIFADSDDSSTSSTELCSPCNSEAPKMSAAEQKLLQQQEKMIGVF